MIVYFPIKIENFMIRGSLCNFERGFKKYLFRVYSTKIYFFVSLENNILLKYSIDNPRENKILFLKVHHKEEPFVAYSHLRGGGFKKYLFFRMFSIKICFLLYKKYSIKI